MWRSQILKFPTGSYQQEPTANHRQKGQAEGLRQMMLRLRSPAA